MISKIMAAGTLLLLFPPVFAAAATSSRVPSSFHSRHRTNLRAHQASLRPEPTSKAARSFPSYTVHNFSQVLDHFNFQTNAGRGNAVSSFTQRYVVLNSSNWSSAAPIFVFTGAEGGNVEEVMWAYTTMVNIASNLGGLVVFLEHRFFGLSVPFNNSYDEALLPRADRVGLLSIEQSLADYAVLIQHIQSKFNAHLSPIITFGGSLAGSLAAFMRLKYPQYVDMAVASSAPVRGYPGLMDKYAWMKQVTQNFASVAPKCPNLVRQAFSAALSSWPNAETLHQYFNTCENASSSLVTINNIEGIAYQKLEGWGEFFYPFSHSNSTTIGPACQRMAAASLRETSENRTLQWYGANLPAGAAVLQALLTRPDGTLPPQKPRCLNITEFNEQGQGGDAKSWDYLACTEIVHPIGSNNVTDMFPPYNWSVSGTTLQCQGHWGGDNWGVTPRPTWIPTEFGLSDLDRFGRLPSSSSRIIFTYGTADPWHVGGIPLNSTVNKETEVIVIKGGSHCADMAPPSTDDTAAMINARARIANILQEWLNSS